MNNPSSPLLKTGRMRRAVKFRTKKDSVTVFTDMEWLALIHEY